MQRKLLGVHVGRVYHHYVLGSVFVLSETARWRDCDRFRMTENMFITTVGLYTGKHSVDIQ